MTVNRAAARLRISAPSLVYGFDLLENVNTLSRIVDHVEIVVFNTPERDNIPTSEELAVLEKVRAETGLTYSVHLPTSYEIAAADENTRNISLQRTIEMIHYLRHLEPDGYILHIPLTAPTLVAEPGCYVTGEDRHRFKEWAKRAGDGLERIQAETGLGRQLLVENINYSPIFLAPFWQKGLCGFCLDIGHLLLGGECVRHILNRYLPVITKIHLHGVIGWQEHLALNVMPKERVSRWIDLLAANAFDGIVNLEVFGPEDLILSLEMLDDILCKLDTT